MTGVTTAIVRDPVGLGPCERFKASATASGTKQRIVYRVAGIGTHRLFLVHNNNVTNLRRAVVERVCCVERNGELQRPPKPTAGAWDTRAIAFWQRLKVHLPYCHPITLQEFVEKYDGRRRQVYQKAVDSLSARAVNQADAVVSPFPKAEKTAIYKWESKPIEDPCPRVIQARTPRYNASVGVYLKPLEKRLFKSIDKAWGSKVVMKGLNAAQTGRVIAEKWGSFLRPVAVGLDMKRFDQHVSIDALKFEHSVYLACYPGLDAIELARLLRMQLVNTGIGRCPDGKVKYTVEGCRMSGDMNTSMGNVLLMCTMAFEFAQAFGERLEYVNNGDDCVFICEEKHLERMTTMLASFFLSFGFTAEIEAPVRQLEKVVFCQTQPVWTTDGWIMVRDPRVCLSKDSTCITLPLEQGDMCRGWMHAIGMCGMALTGGVPVLQEFYQLLLRSSQGTKLGAPKAVVESGMYSLSQSMGRYYQPIHPLTRVSFYNAFCIEPDHQLALEGEYQAMDPIQPIFAWRENNERPESIPINYGP